MKKPYNEHFDAEDWYMKKLETYTNSDFLAFTNLEGRLNKKGYVVNKLMYGEGFFDEHDNESDET